MPSVFNIIREWYRKEFVQHIEHLSVLHAITDEGQLSARFAFMTMLSAAIAVLGLLLSSPAVVIGAMLLSPLMGPIMALGFALCILDFNLLKKSLTSMACGIVLAVAITYGIVYFSPITDATPEIIARTQPNLFDLLVAVFSGLAGGYATIKRKGETIVGVAIATALMPPLAVIGYGLATSQWNATQGACLLFMTNLLAIALTVTALARWYGFGARHSPTHTIWQTALILGVFGALSVPLGVALKNIAYKGYITKTAQSMLSEKAAANQCRVAQFNITFPEGKPVEVRATLLTRRYIADTEQPLQSEMAERIGQPVKLVIDQLIVAHAEEAPPETLPQIAITNNPLTPAAALPALSPALSPTPPAYAAIISYATETLALPVKAQEVDEETRKIVLIIGGDAMPQKAKLKIEKELAQRFPAWKILLRSEMEDHARAVKGDSTAYVQ